MTFRHFDREPCEDCGELLCFKRELMKLMVPNVSEAVAHEYQCAMYACHCRMNEQLRQREDEWRMASGG